MPEQPTPKELLRREWACFCDHANVPATDRKAAFSMIADAYGTPGREYHGLLHPVHLFRVLRMAREGRDWFLSYPRGVALEMAVLYHDLVYDPKRKDNEERSAEVARHHALRFHFSEGIVEDVVRLILATKHAGLPQDRLEQMMVDLDLSPLAVPWESFKRNSEGIRREYKHVSDAEFVLGCRAFLESMLPPKRPHIFSTIYFREHYEVNAQANLTRSLEEQFALPA
jgi:predicted metal-dependent HD superfamily phosphohydrolase